MSPTSLRAWPVLCAALAILSTARADAQQLGTGRRGLAQPAAPVVGREEAIAALRPVHKSYWREGGAITAVAAVLAFTLYAGSMDENGNDEPLGEQVLFSALIAAVFFVPGALVGGLIPKK